MTAGFLVQRRATLGQRKALPERGGVTGPPLQLGKWLVNFWPDAYGHRKKASVAESLGDEIKRRTGEETMVSDLTFSPRLAEPQAPTSVSRGLPAGRPKRVWNSVS
jgi:hypothetical protein